MKSLLDRLDLLQEMGVGQSVDPKERKKATKALKGALRKNKVLASAKTGERRNAKPDEFMLVDKTETQVGWLYRFKHKLSKNYLYLRGNGTLDIPVTSKPFQQGEFPVNAPKVLGDPSVEKIFKLKKEVSLQLQQLEIALKTVDSNGKPMLRKAFSEYKGARKDFDSIAGLLDKYKAKNS